MLDGKDRVGFSYVINDFKLQGMIFPTKVLGLWVSIPRRCWSSSPTTYRQRTLKQFQLVLPLFFRFFCLSLSKIGNGNAQKSYFLILRLRVGQKLLCHPGKRWAIVHR